MLISRSSAAAVGVSLVGNTKIEVHWGRMKRWSWNYGQEAGDFHYFPVFFRSRRSEFEGRLSTISSRTIASWVAWGRVIACERPAGRGVLRFIAVSIRNWWVSSALLSIIPLSSGVTRRGLWKIVMSHDHLSMGHFVLRWYSMFCPSEELVLLQR